MVNVCPLACIVADETAASVRKKKSKRWFMAVFFEKVLQITAFWEIMNKKTEKNLLSLPRIEIMDCCLKL